MDGSESVKIAAPQRPLDSAQPPRRPTPKKLAVAGAVWAVVVAGAVGVSARLDSDPEPACTAAAPPGLPSLRLWLDRPLPPDVSSIPSIQDQERRLNDLATSTDEPDHWIDFGAFIQPVDPPKALEAYQRALAVDPNNLHGKVGLAMLECGTNLRALDRAETSLAALEAENPTSQLVLFNRTILTLYRSGLTGTADEQLPAIVSGFRRTRDLGATTVLGRQANDLVARLPRTPG